MSKIIGWQKYESLIEEQLSSTFLTDIIRTSAENISDDLEENEENDTIYQDQEEEEQYEDAKLMMPVTSKLIEDAVMIASFDCWIGHTNFDITQETKRILDSIEGVEVLRILSRYRFFIGVGKMFKFSDVRNSIEKVLLKEN